MNGSENLWSEEELLSQMEQQQDQIEDLASKLLEQQEENASLTRQLQAERQMLSSEVSKLQSALRTAGKKIREQSGTIERLNGADLLIRQAESIQEEASRAMTAARISREEHDRDRKLLEKNLKAAAEEREKVFRMRRDEENLILKKADALFMTEKEQLVRKHQADRRDLIKEHKDKEQALYRRMNSFLVMDIALLTAMALRTPAFFEDFADAVTAVTDVIMSVFTFSINAGQKAAGLCMNIGQPMLAGSLSTVSAFAIPFILIALVVTVACFIGYVVVCIYMESLADDLSLWMVLIPFAVTVLFAGPIRQNIPLNLIALNLLIHGVYVVIRLKIMARNGEAADR